MEVEKRAELVKWLCTDKAKNLNFSYNQRYYYNHKKRQLRYYDFLLAELNPENEWIFNSDTTNSACRIVIQEMSETLKGQGRTYHKAGFYNKVPKSVETLVGRIDITLKGKQE